MCQDFRFAQNTLSTLNLNLFSSATCPKCGELVENKLFFYSNSFLLCVFCECSPDIQLQIPSELLVGDEHSWQQDIQSALCGQHALLYVSQTNNIFAELLTKDFDYPYRYTQEFIANILDTIGLLGEKYAIAWQDIAKIFCITLYRNEYSSPLSDELMAALGFAVKPSTTEFPI